MGRVKILKHRQTGVNREYLVEEEDTRVWIPYEALVKRNLDELMDYEHQLRPSKDTSSKLRSKPNHREQVSSASQDKPNYNFYAKPVKKQERTRDSERSPYYREPAEYSSGFKRQEAHIKDTPISEIRFKCDKNSKLYFYVLFENGAQSVVSNRQMRKYAPDVLFDFYESNIQLYALDQDSDDPRGHKR